MYFDYIKERENLDHIATESGFITFRIEGENCLISDYYVKPEFRRLHKGKFFADQVLELCKERGVKFVWCQSDESANGHEAARKSILKYGFRESKKHDSVYTYILRVDEWAKS